MTFGKVVLLNLTAKEQAKKGNITDKVNTAK